MKPLIDNALNGNKVTCLEIAEDGAYLISGYKKGNLAIWDLVKYKLIRTINDCH